MLAGFEYQKQNPGKLASLELMKRLYGDHPYAHPSEGTPKSVPTITLAQLQAFHAKAYAAGNVVIALVGDLSRTEAEAIAGQGLRRPAQRPGPGEDRPADRAKGQRRAISSSRPSRPHLLLAQLGIDRDDPDYAALSLGNQILGGGGFGTRLMSEVREKRGLTYGVYSGFTPMQARGPFMINLQTRARNERRHPETGAGRAGRLPQDRPDRKKNWTTPSANWPAASRCPPPATPTSSANWAPWASTTCR